MRETKKQTLVVNSALDSIFLQHFINIKHILTRNVLIK